MSKGFVLVVDDEENILSSLEGILHDDGYDVKTVEEGETALNVIESDHPDLVLLDIWLPGMDGIEVLKTAKRTNVDTEFIMMSGHGSIDTAVKATKLGAFNFIEKPLSLENVLQTVKLAMERRKKNIQNQKRISPSDKINSFEGISKAATEIREQLKTIWKNNRHIVISGDKGTGKSLVEGILFDQISSSGAPCVKVNCDSVPARKAKKYLFGSSSENSGQPGKFELAKNGTIFFDRLDFLPPVAQNDILKALQSKKSNKGSKKNGDPSVRIVAIISGDVESKVQKGALNPELLKLISQRTLSLPPLRERQEDIEVLANYFLAQNGKGSKTKTGILKKKSLELLCRYSWPKNVKELRKTLEGIDWTNPSRQIGPNDLPEAIRRGSPGPSAESSQIASSAKEKEILWDKESIIYHLKKNNWNKKKAARNMRIAPETLEKKMARYGLDLKTLKLQKHASQKTLKRSVVLCGQGLHSGTKTGLILSPLPPDSGIVFCDISTGESITAHLDYVSSTDYSTSLRKDKKVVRTIEHIMAVLHMYQINNLLIKMGDEAPIMDGSAIDFCELIEDGGIEEQEVSCKEIVIDKVYSVNVSANNGKSISIEPAETLMVDYTLDYPPPIGCQKFFFKFSGTDYFKREIAPARTFGFLKDYEKLEEMGLASGGRLNNVILVDDEKVINTSLRFSDEFVRHKILDIIGDFYLLGRFIKGKITARMTGHRENIALLGDIKAHHPDFN